MRGGELGLLILLRMLPFASGAWKPDGDAPIASVATEEYCHGNEYARTIVSAKTTKSLLGNQI